MKETKSLKKIAASVYLCQLLTFILAGFPLLIGVALNFYNKDEAVGTWIESHFDWQIKTALIALTGFAVGGILFEMNFFLVYRMVLFVVHSSYYLTIITSPSPFFAPLPPSRGS